MKSPKHASRTLLAVSLVGIIALTGVSPVSASTPIGQDQSRLPTTETVLTPEEDGEDLVYEGDEASVKIVDSGMDPRHPASARVAAAAGRYIACTLGVHHVHASHHVKGKINGTATIKCKYSGAGPAKVSALVLSYSLIRVSPRNKQWGAGIKKNNNKSSISNNRAVPCSEGAGRFQGWAQGTMTPPRGYRLATAPTLKKYGKTTWAGCGASKPQLADYEASEEITVTFAPID